MTAENTIDSQHRPAPLPPVQDLLSSFEPMVGWSFGCVRAAGATPKLPRQCLEHCLDGSPENVDNAGCAWLRAMVRDATPPPLPPQGRCDRGFTIVPAVDTDETGDQRVFALRDDSHPTTAPADAPPPLETTDLQPMLEKVARLVRQFDAREEENVRLVDEVLQSYEQLNLLFEVTRASITMTGVEEVYDIALDRMSAALRVRFACFLDAHGAFNRTTPKFESDEQLLGAFLKLIADDPQQHIALAARGAQARTLFIPDDDADSQGEPGLSLLVVPLRSGNEVLGAAVFCRPAADPFQTGDQSMAETVMGQVAHMAHRVRLFNDLQQMSIDVVRALVQAIDAKDNYTSGHSERVASWSVLIGQELNLNEEDLQNLAWASRLHDVGKIGIRDDVLGKPGRLTDEEFDHIKQHPVISYEVLKQIHRLAPILGGVRHHHEAWNGSGYPDALAGEEIPQTARIIQMADVFDALTSSRSYRKAFTLENALRIMRDESGTRLDPNMVEVFCRVVDHALRNRSELLAHVPREDNGAPTDRPTEGAK